MVGIYGPHIMYGTWVYEDLAWVVAAQTGALGPWWHVRGLMHWLWQQEWRLSPTPPLYHAISLLLHLIVTAVAGLLAGRLGLPRTGVWIVVTLVLLHRLTHEAVAYAAQQGEILAAIGVLGACVLTAGAWRW